MMDATMILTNESSQLPPAEARQAADALLLVVHSSSGADTTSRACSPAGVAALCACWDPKSGWLAST
jgi:hypothetical protein